MGGFRLERWVVVIKNHVVACALSWGTCPKQQATPLGTRGCSLFIYPNPSESLYEIAFVHGPYILATIIYFHYPHFANQLLPTPEYRI